MRCGHGQQDHLNLQTPCTLFVFYYVIYVINDFFIDEISEC